MRIAIVRGPSLNPWEMQNYLPLAKKHQLLLIGSKKPVYEISDIDLPIVKLSCWGQVLGFVPSGIKALYHLFGDPQGLVGLEEKITGFEIAHTAELFSYYTHQAIVAKKKGKVKKVVATVSENIPFNQEWYPRQRALKEFALANLDHILAISPLSKKAVVIEGYPEERTSVVPHGLDLSKFKKRRRDQKLAKSFGIEEKDFVILSVGRLVWEKGFEDFLLAAGSLVKDKDLKDRELKFLIVGSGPEKKHFIKLTERLGLKRKVVFKDYLPYEKMAQVYRLAEIFILASKPTPTWQEQFGMVLVEAMASGLPIVATRSGAIPEVVGKAGILVNPGNSQELADAIDRLLKDEKLRRDLAVRGLKRARERYDCRKITLKIEKLYQKVLKG